jgi:hypothetical protein
MRIKMCLQILTFFYIGRRNTSLLLNVHNVRDVRQIEIHTAESLAPCPSRLEVDISVTKLKYKLPGNDQSTAVGGETLLSAIHLLINSIWNKEELPDLWKESIIVPIHKKGDKTDCNNFLGISLLSTSDNILELEPVSKWTREN